MSRPVDIGDYVLASRWKDADPHDPWAIGFVIGIYRNPHGIFYHIADSDGKHVLGNYYFRHARRIRRSTGERLVKYRRELGLTAEKYI